MFHGRQNRPTYERVQTGARRSRAQDPTSTEAQLEKALLRDPVSVAQNPNTPPDMLLRLLVAFSEHVLQNPAYQVALMDLSFAQNAQRTLKHTTPQHVINAKMSWVTHPKARMSIAALERIWGKTTEVLVFDTLRFALRYKKLPSYEEDLAKQDMLSLLPKEVRVFQDGVVRITNGSGYVRWFDSKKNYLEYFQIEICRNNHLFYEIKNLGKWSDESWEGLQALADKRKD